VDYTHYSQGSHAVIMMAEDQHFLGRIDDVDDEVMDSMFGFTACLSDNNGIISNYESSDSPCWTYLPAPILIPASEALAGTIALSHAVTISIDGVDHWLLDRARKEEPTVLEQMK
jgi:hypothetical protein